jgi:uncharacterized RDD family membrane protein YckC
MSIVTPEGVVLELTLAGVASRYTAAMIDWIIQGVAIIAILVALGAIGSRDSMEGSGGVLIALAILSIFVILVAYPTFFEVINDGMTPGKRVMGLQVRTLVGGPVTFVASLIRNFLRLIDILPGLAPLVGIIAILVTSKHQRLGDLAAGTVVVRRPTGPSAVVGTAGSWAGADPTAPISPVDPAALAGWDVSGVAAQDLVVLRQFLVRRFDLAPAARHQVALDLANRMWPKVAGAPSDMAPERFVELVVAAKGQRG